MDSLFNSCANRVSKNRLGSKMGFHNIWSPCYKNLVWTKFKDFLLVCIINKIFFRNYSGNYGCTANEKHQLRFRICFTLAKAISPKLGIRKFHP